ncbi:ABC-three component system middle component 6 [Marinifilum sp. N1E240]|uniref:ABC-three component system middle component 6 n=1 Tax=Marinifilum sp. N1E240 TaxID=2608082 RepID=UPI00351A3507
MLLKCLLETEDKKFDINQLYKVFSENEKISFVLFSYTLDWLFMLSLVRVNDKGEIVKCF